MLKLSIIVPVYNVEKYLAKCLDSLVSQSYENLEIIVVNDGSKDGSQKIIDQYVEKYPQKFMSLIKANGGLSDARNYGLKYANGEYIAFIDSDDYVDTDLFEKMMSKIIDTQSDIAVCDLLYEYDDGTVKKSSGGNFDVIIPSVSPEVLSLNNSACNKVFKTSLIKKHPFIVGIWYEDLATIPLVMIEAKSIVKVENTYYHYLQRESSIIHSKNMKVFDIYKALNEIKKSIINQPIYQKPFNRMCVNQAVYLTNLRIKEYSEDRIDFYKSNWKYINETYSNWYFNSFVWTIGIKQWIIFTLFNFKLFNVLDSLYKPTNR